MVSSKNGPSSGSGLSKRARTWSVPPTSNPSRATSSPGTNVSTSRVRRASSGCEASTPARIAAIRRTAATNSPASLARITPRLEDARILDLLGDRARIVAQIDEAEARHRNGRVGETPAHRVLVAGGGDG